MEQYREKLKIQNCILGTGCFALAIFAFLAISSELGWLHILRPSTNDIRWQSIWYGYITGASFGMFAVMLTCLVRNLRALKDERKMKKLYVKTHDERAIQIQTLARNTAMQLLLWIGLIATVITGYFNVTVSITILICTFVSSAASLLLIWYYDKKL